MKKTKEQLQADYDRLADRHTDLQNDFYDVKKERDKLREEAECKDEMIDNLMCQIHFLAWMLYKEWVEVSKYYKWRLNVEIIKEVKKDFKPFASTFTYCNKE